MRTERPDTFEEWFARFGEPYERVVIDNGGTPWPLDPERRAAVAGQLGLPTDTDSMDLRRALWARRFERTTA